MDYSEINKEVRAKIGTKGIKVWVFMNGGWHDIGWSAYNGSSYLHVLSDRKPTWNPKLLTLGEVKIRLSTPHMGLKVWFLSDSAGWEELCISIEKASLDLVYLIDSERPWFHSTQKKIAKLILGENKMTQKPEPQKHRHYDLIMRWASDPTQTVWFWSSEEAWEQITVPTWTVEHYVLGEKPITPPTIKATVKISLDTTELTIELPIGSRKEEIEKAILDKAVQFINHDYEFDK